MGIVHPPSDMEKLSHVPLSPPATPSPPLESSNRFCEQIPLEPRFSLSDDTPRSSRTEFVIGGIRVYVYGLPPTPVSVERASILYMAHQRTRTYKVTEGMAHEILHQYRSRSRIEPKETLLAVTFDMRGHGEREISREANLTWKDGNEQHAADLLSTIDACVQDFQLVISWLPLYLQTRMPHCDRISNYFMGISLGGHTAWRLSTLLPHDLISGWIIVVGCPSLSSLLLERLGVEAKALGVTRGEMDSVPSAALRDSMNDLQRRRWPQLLAEKTAHDDRQLFEQFPPTAPLLLCNGKEDPLVPTFYTADWLRRREHAGLKGIDSTLFVQERTGHSCTKEMIRLIADWLAERISS